jgi:hypothetical protein
MATPAWPYRDYVLSLPATAAVRQFTRERLAGDLMPAVPPSRRSREPTIAWAARRRAVCSQRNILSTERIACALWEPTGWEARSAARNATITNSIGAHQGFLRIEGLFADVKKTTVQDVARMRSVLKCRLPAGRKERIDNLIRQIATAKTGGCQGGNLAEQRRSGNAALEQAKSGAPAEISTTGGRPAVREAEHDANGPTAARSPRHRRYCVAVVPVVPE